MKDAGALPSHWLLAERRARWTGLACLVGWATIGLLAHEQAFQAYLFAYLGWVGLSVGCLALLVLHHLAGGTWGFAIQRILEAGARTLPLMALAFVPILFGLPALYEWARPAAVAHDPLLQHKSVYLNVPFFMLRSALYLALWSGLTLLIERWSRQQDHLHDPAISDRLRSWCAPAMLVVVLTVTFAAFDWMMSLEPHWYSTIYGLLVLVGNGLTALAASIAVAALLAHRPPLSRIANPQLFHDLGNLLLALVLIWAYLAFSQYLIIWAGNLPEDIDWYLVRSQGLWRLLALGLIAVHFILPFALLLAPRNKRRPQALLGIAALLLCARGLDLAWLVLPSFQRSGWPLHPLDLLAVVGLGGVWIAAFLQQLRRRELVPWHDPRLQEVLESE